MYVALLRAIPFLLTVTSSSAATILGSNNPGNSPGDLFDVSNGSIVLSDTGVIGNPGSSADLLGAETSSNVEGPGLILFSDGRSSNSVTFTTAQPVTIGGYRLWLAEDAGYSGNRSATSVSLTTGDGVLLSTVHIIDYGTSYRATYGAGLIEVTDTFPEWTAQTFVITFDSNTNNAGPRVYELDAIAVPEPVTLGACMVGFGFLYLICRRTRDIRPRTHSARH